MEKKVTPHVLILLLVEVSLWRGQDEVQVDIEKEVLILLLVEVSLRDHKTATTTM